MINSRVDFIDSLLMRGEIDNAVNEILKIRDELSSSANRLLESFEFRMPSILIAGPARTATTWLRGVLGKHPSVQVTKGEPNRLFHISRGKIKSTLSWYAEANNWRGPPKLKPLYCDKSPSYVNLSDDDMLITASLLPRMKVVLGIRDERTRLWSVIHHRMRDLQYTGHWTEFCRTHPDEMSFHVNAGHIEHHVQRWRSHFGNNNVFCAKFEDINRSPRLFFDNLLTFLDINSIDALTSKSRTKIVKRISEKEPRVSIGDPPDDLLSIVQSVIVES